MCSTGFTGDLPLSDTTGVLGRHTGSSSTMPRKSLLMIMQHELMEKDKLGLERLVFFSDAVVAIAITLLALDLRIDKVAGHSHITASDIFSEWQTFLAFLLSFLLIALFWLNHHQFFHLIRKIDEPLVWHNMGWLLFIVFLPFSTTLVSADFGQPVTILIYSLNILAITIFQNRPL